MKGYIDALLETGIAKDEIYYKVAKKFSLKSGKNQSQYFDTKGAPADWQMEIKPNNNAEPEVVLDLAHNSVHPGDLIREVMVVSSDPLYPELSVRVEAKVLDTEFSGLGHGKMRGTLIEK